MKPTDPKGEKMHKFRVSFTVEMSDNWIQDGFDGPAIHAKIQELEETLNEFAIPGVECKVSDIKVKEPKSLDVVRL